MEVTTWAKRRQSDTQAVTQVKPNEPRDRYPEADKLEYLEGHERRPRWARSPEIPAGSKGTARVDTEAREEPGRSTAVLARAEYAD
jgi:hypothetical protein